jgi:hypothetical protein
METKTGTASKRPMQGSDASVRRCSQSEMFGPPSDDFQGFGYLYIKDF